MAARNGTLKQGKRIDWTGDFFKRTGTGKDSEKWFVYFGMWKGPFDTPEQAKSAYQEWAWELKHG